MMIIWRQRHVHEVLKLAKGDFFEFTIRTSNCCFPINNLQVLEQLVNETAVATSCSTVNPVSIAYAKNFIMQASFSDYCICFQ